MPNYKMKYSGAEASKMLEVEKNLIYKWAYKFCDYLSPNANPIKGVNREFTIEDIRVFVYISSLWEDEADIEHIRMGLNSREHFNNELIGNFLLQHIPIFIEIPENIEDMANIGALFGGSSSLSDTFTLAESFKAAGDALIDTSLKNEETWKLVCPIIYAYRHATELYLKSITGTTEKRHNLEWLMDNFRRLMKTEFSLTEIPVWFDDIITVFNEFDSKGTSFRYSEDTHIPEVFINFKHLKTKMAWMSYSFNLIRAKQDL